MALHDAETAVAQADVLLVVGTSGLVYPAAGLPSLGRSSGAFVAEVNLSRTPLSDVMDAVLLGASGLILPALLEAVRRAQA